MSALLRLAALDSLRCGAGVEIRQLLTNATENGRRRQSVSAAAAAAAAQRRQGTASGGKEDGSGSFTSEDEEGFSASSSELPPPPPPSAGVTVAAMGMGGKNKKERGLLSWFFPLLPTSLTKILPPFFSSPPTFQQQLSAPSPWQSWESSACSRWQGPWRGARAGLWWRRRAEAAAAAEAEGRAARAAAKALRASSALENSFCSRLFVTL